MSTYMLGKRLENKGQKYVPRSFRSLNPFVVFAFPLLVICCNVILSNFSDFSTICNKQCIYCLLMPCFKLMALTMSGLHNQSK